MLPLGPQHPSAHGVLQVRLTVDGDTVVSAEPRIGFLHRGAEKLFEVRDYRQITVLANRHDWLSAFGSELGVVHRGRADARPGGAAAGGLAAHAAGRAEPGGQPPGVPAAAVRRTGSRCRRCWRRPAAAGSTTWPTGSAASRRTCRPAGPTGSGAAVDGRARRTCRPTLDGRARAAGVLSLADAKAYGVSGPVARASGLDVDLRRDEPYLAYGELAGAGW